jgi:ribonuclease D
VDPLAITDLSLVGEILADPQIEVVFHDADYDLRLLAHEYGFRGANLFDTRIAAQLLNEPGVGLAALLEKYLGVRLDKRYQRADWSARPLTPEMLDYAAADTRHLPELRDLLREQLVQRGRWQRA